ncbi:hypothetical protein F4821DRAFT_243038 [Hypoxylon rubiginosum]|uniref:Uncharacterized protein n=1 Tax=Hypoxylon rubiginosum TaxID=110542 RepID=A0ACC0CV60_9PEZI|nr:hypothetical protein F4821DRAFT_243038 [Hypoxylon rubiginosum]
MEDGDEVSAAMAQAMGFSSFGAQSNPNKRRKYNPHADAVIAGMPNAAMPESSTGSNSTPLGVRIRNADEIDLEDEDDGLDAPNGEVEVPGHLEDGSGGGGTSSGPQFMDTSRPPTVDLVDDIQSKIDGIIGTTPQWPGVETSTTTSSKRGGRSNRERYQFNQGRNWWDDYYDPASNTNPWERLEQTKGLEPRGAWLTWEEAKGATVA